MEKVLWDDQINEQSDDISLNQKLLETGSSPEAVEKLLAQGYSQAM